MLQNRLTARIVLTVSLAFLPACAFAEKVPAKVIDQRGGPHDVTCGDYLTADMLKKAGVVEATFGITVNPDGTVRSAEAHDDSGMPEITTALTACAQHWLFEPATDDGKAVESFSVLREMFHDPSLSKIDILMRMKSPR
jgi:hypothetical protein